MNRVDILALRHVSAASVQASRPARASCCSTGVSNFPWSIVPLSLPREVIRAPIRASCWVWATISQTLRRISVGKNGKQTNLSDFLSLEALTEVGDELAIKIDGMVTVGESSVVRELMADGTSAV